MQCRPPVIMTSFTTGSCMKCGYQAKPRKDHSVDVESSTCPKCNAELT